MDELDDQWSRVNAAVIVAVVAILAVVCVWLPRREPSPAVVDKLTRVCVVFELVKRRLAGEPLDTRQTCQTNSFEGELITQVCYRYQKL